MDHKLCVLVQVDVHAPDRGAGSPTRDRSAGPGATSHHVPGPVVGMSATGSTRHPAAKHLLQEDPQ